MSLNWRQRQKQALRRQIYDTAIGLFTEQGYEGTTVRQITERLALAKGTFFNHFPSKEHVVAEWYQGITEDSLAAARRRRAASAEKAVASLFADMAKRATREPELLIAKFSLGTDPLLLDAERDQVEGIDTFVREQCATAVGRGELRADLDVDFFCGLLVAMLTGTSRSWVTARPRFDFPALIRRRITFLFDAVRPPQGEG